MGIASLFIIFCTNTFAVNNQLFLCMKANSSMAYRAINDELIINILSKQEYCGDVINFKTYSKSYKNKKRYENDKENWAIFKDIHEPIIDRTVWEKIQERRSRRTRKKPVTGEDKNMFSGLLVCADCGSKLGYHFNQANHDITYFN